MNFVLLSEIRYVSPTLKSDLSPTLKSIGIYDPRWCPASVGLNSSGLTGLTNDELDLSGSRSGLPPRDGDPERKGPRGGLPGSMS